MTAFFSTFFFLIIHHRRIWDRVWRLMILVTTQELHQRNEGSLNNSPKKNNKKRRFEHIWIFFSIFGQCFFVNINMQTKYHLCEPCNVLHFNHYFLQVSLVTHSRWISCAISSLVNRELSSTYNRMWLITTRYTMRINDDYDDDDGVA